VAPTTLTALGFCESDQICQRPALADEIVHNKIMLPRLYLSEKVGLVGEPLKAARARVAHRVTYLSGTDPVSIGRGDKIRTCDPLHPMQVRYQAAPRPDRGTE
jgi:hypothetical protein